LDVGNSTDVLLEHPDQPGMLQRVPDLIPAGMPACVDAKRKFESSGRMICPAEVLPGRST